MTSSSDRLPVTGAWQPGQPSGSKRFFTFATDHPFAVERGAVLRDVTVAYETWGTLDDDASNAILMCHAWTGDSHASGRAEPGHPTPGWWNDVVGPGRYIDTDRWFVVCANVLGGCQGSTGPASPHPDDGQPYGSRFPVITIRDMVRAQAQLMEHLGIARWASVIGGSMGGMQVLEWAIMYSRRVRSIVPIACCMQASAQQIAWGVIGRRAIRLDPNWRGGDYYDAEPGDGPWHGLAVARQISQITYRTGESFADRFGRDHNDPIREFDQWGRFEIESYLDHHGQKLVRRFDANSFLILSKAMDLHDLGRGRGGTAATLGRFEMPVLTASISSDALYLPQEQREIHDAITAAGGRCRYHVIESAQGHDGFLLEHEALGPLITEAIEEAEKSDD